MKRRGHIRDGVRLRIGDRLTKAGVAAEARFDALVNAYLATVGTKPGWFGYEWSVETRAGLLGVGSRGHYIVCMFKEPERAKALLGPYSGLNSYSGKWNHHYDLGADETEVDNFKAHLRLVLP